MNKSYTDPYPGKFVRSRFDMNDDNGIPDIRQGTLFRIEKVHSYRSVDLQCMKDKNIYYKCITPELFTDVSPLEQLAAAAAE